VSDRPCHDCGIRTVEIGEDYMVREDMWLAVHP